MPTYKETETEFEMAVHWHSTQYRANIPKMLMERVRAGAVLRGTFTLQDGKLRLQLEEAP